MFFLIFFVSVCGRDGTPHRSETHGNAERAVRREKKELRQYWFNLHFKNAGGQ